MVGILKKFDADEILSNKLNILHDEDVTFHLFLSKEILFFIEKYN